MPIEGVWDLFIEKCVTCEQEKKENVTPHSSFCKKCGFPIEQSFGTWHHVQHPAGHNAQRHTGVTDSTSPPDYAIDLSQTIKRSYDPMVKLSEFLGNKEFGRLSQFLEDWVSLGTVPSLETACADFYVLLNLAYDEQRRSLTSQPARGLYTRQSELLSHVFEFYLRMTLGGEIRHFWSTFVEGRYERLEGLPPWMQSYLEEVKDLKREDAWVTWLQTYESSSLRELKKTYTAVFHVLCFPWESYTGQVGGEGWRQAAKLLLNRLNGMDPSGFVNMCWNLRHNNNYIFDKVWDCPGLQALLQEQADSNGLYTADFVSHCSPSV